MKFRMRGAITASVLLFLTIGCSTKPHDLSRVRIEYWQEYGMVGFAYKITIQGNGNVRYEGHRSVGVPGAQEYVLPQQTVETIVSLLRDSGFFSMRENLSTGVMDCGIVQIRYSDGQRNKLVVDNCRELLPKYRHSYRFAGQPKNTEHEPGLQLVAQQLTRLAGADRFVHSTLTDYALLAAKGWDVNTVGDQGWTALASALFRRDRTSAEFLLQNGAVLSEDALIGAAGMRDDDSLKMLLRVPNISHQALNRAALYSARSRNLRGLEMLLNAGASPNGDGDSGLGIPIFGAVGTACGACIAVLVKHAADVNARDEQGRTPLMAAARGSDAGIVAQLIRLGAQLNTRDRQGNTALMSAARSCYYWTMIPLVQAGATLHPADLERGPLMDPLVCDGAGSDKTRQTSTLLKTAMTRAQ